ncbi:MAG: hypothetical protein IKC82_03040 [Lentisphaeria bacterium]|nr:hypothetical protein [Lentisphaeria bacterium]
MKKALIIFNLVLAAVVAVIVFNNLTHRPVAVKKVAAKTAVKSSSKRQSVSADKVKEEAKSGAKLLAPDAAAAKIVEKDVFNQIRSPLAYTRTGRSEMTLVGVIDGKAAIIKTNTRQRQYNPFLAQAMRMSSGMTGRGGGRFTQWSQISGNRNNGPVQQYVRIGETMSSGYVLSEVSRSRAVLVRGNDKVELELQDPSKNRAQARRAGIRLNSTQQFQQAQMFMQSQMIRTMREIQQNSRSNAPAGNRNRR